MSAVAPGSPESTSRSWQPPLPAPAPNTRAVTVDILHFWFVETVSLCVAQADLELSEILLPQPPRCGFTAICSQAQIVREFSRSGKEYLVFYFLVLNWTIQAAGRNLHGQGQHVWDLVKVKSKPSRCSKVGFPASVLARFLECRLPGFKPCSLAPFLLCHQE